MRKVPEFFIAVILSALFAIALLYVTLEIPSVVNTLLLNYFSDYSASEWTEATAKIESLRPFGYVSFVATLILMSVGFIAKRGKLAISGSIALYLPTFGYFAFTMFFLAGIGILRVL